MHVLLAKKTLCQQKLAKAVNNLVEKDELVAWNRMEEERRERTVTKLLHTVEESALALAQGLQTPNELQIKDTQMGKVVIDTLNGLDHYYHLSILFPRNESVHF